QNWFSRESEAYVIGACMIDPRRIPEARAIVCSDDFGAVNSEIFGAILAVFDDLGGIDLPTLVVRLKQNNFQPGKGWVYELAQLVENHPGPFHSYHARLVRDLAKKRKRKRSSPVFRTRSTIKRSSRWSRCKRFKACGANRRSRILSK